MQFTSEPVHRILFPNDAPPTLEDRQARLNTVVEAARAAAEAGHHPADPADLLALLIDLSCHLGVPVGEMPSPLGFVAVNLYLMARENHPGFDADPDLDFGDDNARP